MQERDFKWQPKLDTSIAKILPPLHNQTHEQHLWAWARRRQATAGNTSAFAGYGQPGP